MASYMLSRDLVNNSSRSRPLTPYDGDQNTKLEDRHADTNLVHDQDQTLFEIVVCMYPLLRSRLRVAECVDRCRSDVFQFDGTELGSKGESCLDPFDVLGILEGRFFLQKLPVATP